MKKITAIHQVTPVFSHRDAVGNEIRLLSEHLRSLGYHSEIFYENAGVAGQSLPLSKISAKQIEHSVFIQHFSVGSTIPLILARLNAKIWTRYHNITPAVFFKSREDSHPRHATAWGRRQIPLVANITDLLLAVSDYNAKEMLPWLKNSPVVMPLFRDYELLLKQSQETSLISQLPKDEKTVLFVGRICPNKAQHDLVEYIYLFQKVFSERLRLVLLGGYYSREFQSIILKFAGALGLKVTADLQNAADADIVIRGSVSDQEMAAWYRQARIFFSASEHEGFGVPLVEAMWFELPILAHRSSAVTETVADAACLIDKFNYQKGLTSLYELLHNEQLRRDLRQKMQQRRENFSLKRAKMIFDAAIQPALANY